MRASTTRGGTRARQLCFTVALFASACGGGNSNPPPSSPSTTPSGTSSSSAGAITVTGTEKIGWGQPADSASQLSHYRYVGFVDDVPEVLANVVCATTLTNGVFPCSASLPKMAPGSHRLEIATQEVDGAQQTSARSPTLLLNVVTPSNLIATTQLPLSVKSYDGIQLVAETLATGLAAPSALAAAADGRVFVANRNGDVLVWQSGKLSSTPALRLGDVAQTSDVGLIGLALDPEFASNGLLYIAYTARDPNGGFVQRVLRVRGANGGLAQPIGILEDRVSVAPLRPPRIRVAADHTVYVGLPAADQPTAESHSSYAGKILRINEDGTTPRDNPAATPVISSGEATTGGLDWQPATKRLWLAGRDWQGRDFIRDFLLGNKSASTFESLVDPSGAAFYSHSRIAGFANDLFIAALNGRHLRRVHFNTSDPTRIEITEHLLDGQYGRISDVAVGPDGALYFCTSNAGTTSAAPDDDRLIRVTSGS